MIKLDISTALFLYLLFNVIGVLLLWVFFGLRTKRSSFKKDEDYVWRCSICANLYIDSKNQDLSRCPQCGSYNKKENMKEAMQI
ncbi:MAG: hypothetical protein KAU58_05675 [Candidatus Omnitrophica bacterium]|nr:hypothetical protein [Candidatus Omnitrophota bacterium]